MSSISAIALSGMTAALQRLTAAASNIANAHSNGPLPGAPNSAGYPPAYSPIEVVQSPVLGGGVLARIVPSPTAPVAIYDPSAPYADSQGMVAAPDVDVAAELLDLVTARYDFAANLMVLRTESAMYAALFDIKA
jgi:flagellar basal-body rod protein FlgC